MSAPDGVPGGVPKGERPRVELDVVSDIVCPWCWLGKRRLDAAIAALPDIDVDVRWRPFQLDPNVPNGGQDYGAYMRAKFGVPNTSGGGSDRFTSMRDHLMAAAPDAGITFRFDEIPTRPNTFNAHRLVRWAQGQNAGGAVKEALFKAFFDDLKDIGDPAVLSEIAGAIGLDARLVAELLASDRDVSAVTKEEEFFRNLGVSGVPTFIANGRTAVQGAQESEALAAFLRQAAAEGPAPEGSAAPDTPTSH